MTEASVAVVGAGVIGLTTALELARSGLKVTIISEKFSSYWNTSLWSEEIVLGKNIVSDVAAASFIPHSDETRQLKEWLMDSSRFYGQLSPSCGVVLQEGLELSEAGKRPWFLECVFDKGPFSSDTDSQATGITKSFAGDAKKEAKGWKYATYMIEPRFFLPWLRAQLELLGVSFLEQKIEDMGSLSGIYDIIVNCTGFGARRVAKDDSVEERGGQILVLRHSGLNTWIRDKSDSKTIAYVYPQRNTVIVGGTKQIEVGKSEEMIKAELFEKGVRLLPSISNYPLISLNEGQRPYRPSFRVEKDEEFSINSKKATLIHNYGQGGEGYCFGPGCAIHVRKLVDSILNRLESNSLRVETRTEGMRGQEEEGKSFYQMKRLATLDRFSKRSKL